MARPTAERFSRRQFIQLAGASLAGLAGCTSSDSSDDFDVIVVGAGVAGMAAGAKLKALGRRAKVLEARDRIGGRCYNDNSFPAPFDFGGQFFHQVVSNGQGGTNNPLYDLYRKQGGADVPVELVPQFFAAGAALPPAQQAELAVTVGLYSVNVGAAAVAAQLGAPDISVATAVAELSALPWFTLANAIVELALDGPPERLSCLDVFNDVVLGLSPDLATSDRINPTGMGNFVNQLAEGLDIALSTRVLEIDTSGIQRVKVVTDRGKLTARAVIVTAPMTVLAAGKITFTPPLPTQYEQAFHDLPFGLVDKLGIAFRTDVFSGVADNTSVTRHLDTSSGSTGVARMGGKANMMNLLVGGQLARDLEAGGIAAFNSFAAEFLTATFGASMAASIDRTIVHPWGTDEWSMGSYSAARVGKVGARTTLATPINGRIYFAGEAVSTLSHSALHGAYLTAQKAATDIDAQLG
jgi:monoamine oxidase